MASEKKPKKQKLTEKQKLFCQVYIKNFNASMAVIKAGYDVKSNDTASVIGYQLLQKTSIREEITRLKAIKMRTLLISEDDILDRFMRIAFADMTDFVEFGREVVPVLTMYGVLENTNPVTGLKETVMKEVNTLKFKESTHVDGALICQIKQGKEGASIKLEDRQRALEWLADYFEMNPMNRHKKKYDEAILVQKEKELEHKIHSSQETQDIISQAKGQFEAIFNKLENFAPNRKDLEDD